MYYKSDLIGKDIVFKKNSLSWKIENIAINFFNLNKETGQSSLIIKQFLNDNYPELSWNNGCSHIRKESPLNRKYIIESKIIKGENIGFKFNGYKDNIEIIRTPIPSYVREILKQNIKNGKICECPGCIRKQSQVDHRDGFFSSGSELKDFAFICDYHNPNKREHCKKCRKSLLRPDGSQIELGDKNPCKMCAFYTWNHGNFIKLKMQINYNNLQNIQQKELNLS